MMKFNQSITIKINKSKVFIKLFLWRIILLLSGRMALCMFVRLRNNIGKLKVKQKEVIPLIFKDLLKFHY